MKDWRRPTTWGTTSAISRLCEKWPWLSPFMYIATFRFRACNVSTAWGSLTVVPVLPNKIYAWGPVLLHRIYNRKVGGKVWIMTILAFLLGLASAQSAKWCMCQIMGGQHWNISTIQCWFFPQYSTYPETVLKTPALCKIINQEA